MDKPDTKIETDATTLIGAAFGWVVVFTCIAGLTLWLTANLDIKDAASRDGMWQAWATFATGVMAVGAALFVGVRQAEIQAKQVAIQERQIESERDLREKEIRLELLNRRAEAVNQMSRFYRDHAHTLGPISSEERHRIFDALTSSQLVFPTIISDKFRKCIESVNWRKSNLETAHTLHSGGYHQQAIPYESAALTLTEAIMVDFGSLRDAMIAHARVDL